MLVEIIPLLILSFAAAVLSNPIKSSPRQLRDTVAHSRQAQAWNPYGYTTSRTISLRRSPHDLQHSSRALRKRATHLTASSDVEGPGLLQAGSTFLRATGASFLAEISFGSQTFLSVVDTGSSDTWIVHNDFTCVDIITNQAIPRDRCYFGPQYQPGDEFRQIPDANFNITYGDGEYLTGPVGTLPVTLADIRVSSQQVSLPNLAAWQGDGVTSGIIGLAYPALTAAYPGTNPHLDRYCRPGGQLQNCNQIVYSSLINTMFFEQKLTAPIFALALSRDESNSGNGGYLSIGGIPDLNTVGVKSPEFASTPIRILPQDDQFRYYLINIDGLVMLPAGTPIPEDSRWQAQYAENLTNMTTAEGNITSSTPAANDTSFNSTSRAFPTSEPTSYILDSGTTLSFLPSNLIYRYANMFRPPARFDPSTGFYFVDCQAQVPPLGVKIGGKVFWHKSMDLIKQYDYAGTTCILGVQDSGRLGGVNILGDTFLGNVLAVFDLGEGVVRFAGRREYSS
ncbi:hypothetical protein LTR70_007133 [Exophiala xenobiotica]|uniref:Peptidase A1 domain-containing protein n=1 Tax=Lithohypha guttulata TaxID=1690604 RepID=A0ABR0K7X3_9EURO|nr:hypothetical protein LTR24_006330 [Lithohypha guttulata]KAK5314504.1 hypothetical protein LTR70_007133 [Exophiala xenobiotica]